MSATLTHPGDIDAPTSSHAGVALDGGMMFWAGLSYGTASFVNYLILSGRMHVATPAMIGLVWMGATAAFLLFGVILKVGSDRLLLQHPSVKRFRAIWSSMILGAAVVIAALMIMMAKFGVGAQASFVISPIVLGVYGIGWRFAAISAERHWPNVLCLGCFAGAIGLALLAGTAEQSLVYTLCQMAFAVLPGLALLLRQQSA